MKNLITYVLSLSKFEKNEDTMAQITLKGNSIRTNGSLPTVGSSAPDFVLVDGELNNRSLADYKGKRKLLSIVPSLDTQVCAASAKKFNEKIQSYPEVLVLYFFSHLPFSPHPLFSP